MSHRRTNIMLGRLFRSRGEYTTCSDAAAASEFPWPQRRDQVHDASIYYTSQDKSSEQGRGNGKGNREGKRTGGLEQ